MKEKNSEMEGFYKTYYFIIKKLWFINSVLIIGSLILKRVDWSGGFLVGCLAAHFFFSSIKRDIEKMAKLKNFSRQMAFKGHLFRFFGTGLIFAIGLYTKKINLWTMLIGFFTLHFLLFCVRISPTEKGE